MRIGFLLLVFSALIWASCTCYGVDTFCPGSELIVVFEKDGENIFYGSDPLFDIANLEVKSAENESAMVTSSPGNEALFVNFPDSGTYFVLVGDATILSFKVEFHEGDFQCCSDERGIERVLVEDLLICSDFESCTQGIFPLSID